MQPADAARQVGHSRGRAGERTIQKLSVVDRRRRGRRGTGGDAEEEGGEIG